MHCKMNLAAWDVGRPSSAADKSLCIAVGLQEILYNTRAFISGHYDRAAKYFRDITPVAGVTARAALTGQGE